MRAKQARLRFFGMAALAAVLGVSFYLLSYEPQSDALREKEAEAVSLRRAIAEAAAFRRSHPDPAKEAKKLAERKRAVERLLPTRLDAGAFLLEAEKRAADQLFVLGPLGKLLAEGARGAGFPEGSISCFEDREELGAELERFAGEGDAVLFKASNSMKLFELADRMGGNAK